ncbi:carbohydrate kinase family protein [Caldivirga maquilingensis]|uniref:PfkB domain protein n=1 Tax=Caldivirga maquilingensis (strain ATCC 700844 / DSM 13496 / JCM 10307 / IC-167) TaxID=397948 RepID=A8MA65_CALMQ|nr:carbohydrate kinase family protein [Caldivirga maquilingensis]ABW00997.1 PfkB domain protein [Caldivirga maquilingensis IC-167]
MKKPTIASVGNLNLDVYFRIQSLPENDGAVEAYEAYIGGGGSAANFAIQASKLGAYVRFIGAVGSDTISDALLEDLKEAGVDVKWVKRINVERSGLVVVLIGPENGKRMIEYRGANLGLTPSDVNSESLNGVNHLHVALSRLNIIEAGVKRAKELGLTVSVDGGAGLSSYDLNILKPLMDGVNTWFMNSLEARKLTGIDDPISAGLRILESINVEELIITLGPGGAVSFTKDGAKLVEAFKVAPIDTTGAGDVFAASYVFAKLIGLDRVSRLIFANAAASIKVTRRGARAGPSFSEVLEFLRTVGYSDLTNEIRSILN